MKYIPPVLETTTEKDDALDWENIPEERCDLNYRSLAPRPSYVSAQTVGVTALVSLVCFPIAVGLQRQIGEHFASTPIFVFLMLIGCGGALVCHLQDFPLRLVLACLIAPAAAWTLVVVAPFHKEASASLLIFMAFAIPALFWFSDAVATHAVYWMSAHYKNDHATMLGWREDWSKRFSEIADRPPRRNDMPPAKAELHRAVMTTRAAYRNGLLWLPLVIVVPGVVILSGSYDEDRNGTGFFLTFALFVSLIIGCIVRTIQFPGSWQRTWYYVTDFLWHGSLLRQPPWVFRSPGGSGFDRLMTGGVILAIVSLTLLPLSDYLIWLILGGFNADLLPEAVQNPNPFTVAWTVLPGSAYGATLFLIQHFLLFIMPGACMYLAVHLLAGPTISAHYLALEAPHAYEHHPEWDRLDGYSERLRKSRNRKEQQSILIARQLTNDYPVLMHLKLAFEHVHMLGATGIGKTVLGLMTHMIQLIRRKDGPVVIIDCKGDQALFNTARIEAKKAGRKFKWFTNSLNRSTYVFNPFDKNIYSQLSLQEIVGLLMNALNMHHGSDYGRAWFTIASRILLKRAFEETVPENARRGPTFRTQRHRKFERIESFKDLNDIILFLAEGEKEYQAAQHLAFLIESLAEFEQLNLSPRTHPNHPAFDNAINMSQVIENNEVVYFYLEGAIDSVSVAEIARLAVFSLLSACINHKGRTGQKARAYLMVDEAQAVIAQNITHVLAQARSYGLACFLANQTMSQLNPSGGPDLREIVMGCTSVKQVFSARDPWLQKYVAEMSGKVTYANLSYQKEARDVMSGMFGLEGVLENELRQRPVSISTYIGNRLNTQDLLDNNRDPNKCFLAIERSEAFSRWKGFAPVFVDWPMHEIDYEKRSEGMPWPEESPETITLTSPWPATGPEVVVPNATVNISEAEHAQQMVDRLRRIKQDADKDE